MSDELSAIMRQMIDAFPEERVTRIPRGVSGETSYVYVPERGRPLGTRTAHDAREAAFRIRGRGFRFQALLRREAQG